MNGKLKFGIGYLENPREYRRLQSKARLVENRLRNTFSTAKYRAKKRGWNFDLVVEELIVPDKCPIMNIPLFYTDGKRTDNSPSLDRVDNNKGYTKDNVRVISWLANSRKGDMTIEQIDNLYHYIHGRV